MLTCESTDMADAAIVAAIEAPFDSEPDELAVLTSRLRKDIALAAKAMPVEEARFVVDVYYQVQRYLSQGPNSR